MEIIPAIIAKTFEDLEEKMSNVAKLVPMVQLDVLDGSLVPFRAWPYQSPKKLDSFFDAVIREEQGFPFWQGLEFEAHFMVREPERYIADWIAAGASRIIIQIEGVSDFKKCVEAAAGRITFGVSIGLDSSKDILKEIAADVAVIQTMGWTFSHLGKQGEPLDEGVFDTIRELRRSFPTHLIAVDGGVTLENAAKLSEAGANRLVVGSALWRGDSLRENLAKFKKLAR